jgi:DNA end-binding protein Ku
MAGQLIADMTEDWQGERYEDRFTQALMALVEQRAAAGRTEQVQPLEANAEAAAANVVDLTELLKRSLGRGKPAAAASAAAPAAKKASAPRRRATRRRA